MRRELLKMFAFGFPFEVLMNNIVENNNIITCYWQDQFRTCNIGHESEDRFAFGCELDEMLSQVFPQACIPQIPPQLSSLSLMPYFRLFSCTHLSHIPCEAQIRTRTVHKRKRERWVRVNIFEFPQGWDNIPINAFASSSLMQDTDHPVVSLR